MFLVGTEEGKIYKVKQRASCASSLIGWLRPESLELIILNRPYSDRS